MDVRTLCLGALTTGDKTGYEIKRCFEEAFSHFFVAGFGSIYPALDDLTRKGLVTCTVVEQDRRPDKKVYRLTGAGHRALVEELAATPPRHKVRSEFLVLMYFAHLLPPERLGRVIDDMVAQWDAFLEALDGADGARCPMSGESGPGVRFTVGYGRAVLGAAKAYVLDHKEELLREAREAAAAPEPEADEPEPAAVAAGD